ncbi:hypothetical protein PENFLA_c003G10253 [Penicillium flavigenum]|uniref:Cytochrome P450 n=1 Tax=Penicillium flavigenum TaxID=254877 RepID=A0A1V6TY13_9EURO|nr:hypothetical protein PENFLA_c003G10253 [Penicillium flavigenum]
MSRFVPDAGDFRPGRWLEADEEKRKTMERAVMWYGQGKHICLGQHIARVEMMKILAMPMMRFQVSDTDPEATLSVRPYSAIGYPDRPYFITVKEKQIAASGA